MNQSKRVYSPREFVEKLTGEGFSAPLAFKGMVKKAEDDAHLLFANGISCDNWIQIPVNIIDNIEFLNIVRCRDHTHPFVSIFIKEPASEEAKLFAALASSQHYPGMSSDIVEDGMGELQRRLTNARIGRDAVVRRQFARGVHPNACVACWRFCAELTTAPDFNDFLWCLNFCGPLCPD